MKGFLQFRCEHFSSSSILWHTRVISAFWRLKLEDLDISVQPGLHKKNAACLHSLRPSPPPCRLSETEWDELRQQGFHQFFTPAGNVTGEVFTGVLFQATFQSCRVGSPWGGNTQSLTGSPLMLLKVERPYVKQLFSLLWAPTKSA